MKRNHLHLLVMSIIMFVLMLFGVLQTDIFRTTVNILGISINIYYLLFWLIATTILILRFGLEKDKHLYKTDVLQIIFIFTVAFLIITYLVGLITGFTMTPYNLAFLKIIENITPVIIVIVCQELIRYIVVKKGNKINIALIVLFFVTTIIALNIRAYNLSDPLEIFECLGILILPAIISNLLLTYIVKKNGYKPALLYRFMFELPIYLIPIAPDLGIYITSMLNIIFPVVLFLKLNAFFGKVQFNQPKRSIITKLIIIMPSALVLLIVIVLVSGIFRVYALAIISNSMRPHIKRGDAVIVEKLAEKDLNILEINDIIVFEHDNKIVVHRVTEIKNINNRYIFQTKGDNNN